MLPIFKVINTKKTSIVLPYHEERGIFDAEGRDDVNDKGEET